MPPVSVSQKTIQITNQSTNKVLIPACRLAITTQQQQLGFQHQPTLADDEGILFMWSEPGRYPMHMRNVNFPLLMAWIDDKQRIIFMRIATPESPDRYGSPVPVRMCLECNPIQCLSLELGDHLTFGANTP